MPDTGGVYFVPAFGGLLAPWWQDDARGVVVGLTQYSTKVRAGRWQGEKRGVVLWWWASRSTAPAGSGWQGRGGWVLWVGGQAGRRLLS